MIPMSLAEVARVTGGRLHGVTPEAAEDLRVDADVVTDSREARPGSLYVARVGEHADGHAFVPAAAEAGAVAALTTREVDGLPCVVVPDEQAGFVAIARHVVDSGPDLTVIGITGSSGKTSTKDLLGTVLAAAGETVAPVGSYNSEVGVPLTVCRVTPSTRYLVVEMGARGIGHIDYLARIAPPSIGIVLNVGHAHVGEFGSIDAVARAKGELPASLPADGVAVLNADDHRVAAMAGGTAARVVLVGESDAAAVRATDITADAGGRPRFTLTTPFGSAHVELALVGRHHVGNALSVVAAAHAAGLDLETIVAALRTAGTISRWRMEVTTREDGVVVVNDAYNANPDSVSAALRSVAAMTATGRRWAVLGGMLELGADSDVLHEQVGREAAQLGMDQVLVVGDVAAPVADGARAGGAPNVRRVPDAAAAERLLDEELDTGDVVLFKSSRDSGLRWLGDRIVERGAGL